MPPPPSPGGDGLAAKTLPAPWPQGLLPLRLRFAAAPGRIEPRRRLGSQPARAFPPFPVPQGGANFRA